MSKESQKIIDTKKINIIDNVNITLYKIIVFIIYVIIFVYIIIFIFSLYNFIVYIYYTMMYNISEDLLSENIKNDYYYGILNYIKCFKDEEKKKEKDGSLYYYLNPLIFLYDNNITNNDTDNIIYNNEKYFLILIQFLLYIIIAKLILIIIIIILMGSIITLLLSTYNPINECYDITKGTTFIIYLYNNNLSLIILISFIIAIIIYLGLYKGFFIDIIYNNIYKKYENILTLDEYIKSKVLYIKENDDKYNEFFNLFKNITLTKNTQGIFNINSSIEVNITDNIETTQSDDVKKAKCLILGFFKYMIRINQADIDITNKIYNFIIKTDIESELISLRDLLPKKTRPTQIIEDIDTVFKDLILLFPDILDNDSINELKDILKNLINIDNYNLENSFSNIGFYNGVSIIINLVILIIVFKFIIYYNSNEYKIIEKIICNIQELLNGNT